MKVPLEWLREYVDVSGSTDDLVRDLIMAGVGVEAVEGDVLELEITANRADLLSMLGVAREVGVIRKAPVRVPKADFAEGGGPVSDAWTVEVPDADLCPRYTARLIRGVKVGPSPDGMARRLEAAGIRPVNNIVDVTNLVLLETGQPLHAFDAAKLRGGRIVARRAAKGEKMVAIDGGTYELSNEMLVIADAERPVAIAGVMGGKETEISDGTVDVLLESAQFDPVSVRRTSRKLKLFSDSSYRFERGVSRDGVEEASRRAVHLILEVAGGKASAGVVDVSVAPKGASPAKVRPARVSAVLGLEIAPARVREILVGLGCGVSGSDAELVVTAPATRRDLHGEVDYIEEVARIEGYDKIPCDTSFPVRVAVESPGDAARAAARETLTGMGAYEALTWSFEAAQAPNRVPYWTDASPIPLRDPEGRVDRTLRESLAPGLLRVLNVNEAYKEPLRPVFEIARVYRQAGREYGDLEVLGIAAPGDPLVVKGLVETLLERLGVAFEVKPSDGGPLGKFLEPGTAAEILAGGTPLGYMGRPVASLSDLRSRAGVAEVDFGSVASLARLQRPYREVPRQPPVARDLSVEIGTSVRWGDVEAAIRKAAPPLLEAVRFLSEYRGKGVGKDRKGWAFSMVFRAPDRTLKGEEVEAAVEAVFSTLEKEFQAVRR